MQITGVVISRNLFYFPEISGKLQNISYHYTVFKYLKALVIHPRIISFVCCKTSQNNYCYCYLVAIG